MAKPKFRRPKAVPRLKEDSLLPSEVRVRTRNIRSLRPRMSTSGINGIEIATIPFTTRPPIRRRTAITLAPATSMLTARGVRFPITARFGFLELILTGHHIETAAGSGSRIGVGLGFLLSPGVGRHITMAAGSSRAEHGLGGPARSIPRIVRSGRLPMSLSSDLAEV